MGYHESESLKVDFHASRPDEENAESESEAGSDQKLNDGEDEERNLLSHIRPISLGESVDGFQGRYASVSVLEPVMRVERSGMPENGVRAMGVYRIILNFTVQIAILGFEKNRQTRPHNRIFDSLSLRFLYRRGERHSVLPHGDAMAGNINFTNQSGTEDGVQVGLSGTGGQPTPSFTVHAQHTSRITYERRLSSWRKALTFESYPPVQPYSKGRGLGVLLARLKADLDPMKPPFEAEISTPSFHVTSDHEPRCACRSRGHLHASSRTNHDRRPCHYRASRSRPYDRCAHWSGQTQAQLHLWTPEIYGNMNCPITVSREVDAEEVDRILSALRADHASSSKGAMREADLWSGLALLKRHVHFDFDIEIRLRELGWQLRDLFRAGDTPPEIRARNDPGKALPSERAAFCISPCVEKVSWPEFETRDLQDEAEDQVAKHGIVRRLHRSKEYAEKQNAGHDAATQHYRNHQRETGPQFRGRTRTPATSTSSSDGVPATRPRRRVSFSPDGLLRTCGRLLSGRQSGHTLPVPPTVPSPPVIPCSARPGRQNQ